MLPKIEVNQQSAFSINTSACENGSLLLSDVKKSYTMLKTLAGAQRELWKESSKLLSTISKDWKDTADFWKDGGDTFKKHISGSMSTSSTSDEKISNSGDHHQPKPKGDIKLSECLQNQPNPNSKESWDSDIYDKYIEEYRFKSDETKRKRVLYTCKYESCDKQYHKRWNLVDHIKTHLGVMPYKCDLCSMTFVQKGNLKKHLRQHEFPDMKKRKAFQCSLCNKSYTERYNLTHHMKRHSEEDTPKSFSGNDSQAATLKNEEEQLN